MQRRTRTRSTRIMCPRISRLPYSEAADERLSVGCGEENLQHMHGSTASRMRPLFIFKHDAMMLSVILLYDPELRRISRGPPGELFKERLCDGVTAILSSKVHGTLKGQQSK